MESPRDGASFVVVPTLLLVVSTSVILADAKETAFDRVKWVCGQLVQDRASCLDVFLSSPKTHKTKDMRALAYLALDLGSANATNCIEAVKQLHAKPGLPEALHPVLDFCAGRFRYSAQQFRNAKVGLKHGDAESAYYVSGLPYDGARDCDLQMADKNVTDAEVAALGMNIRFFSNIADSTINALLN